MVNICFSPSLPAYSTAMPELVGSDGMTSSIPDDIRFLKNFPHYDTSLHDTPRFRQHLSAWANKTEKASLQRNHLIYLVVRYASVSLLYEVPEYTCIYDSSRPQSF